MTVETALYPNQLNATLPPQSDIVREGAGHLRLLKTVVKTTFPNVAGAVYASQMELNYVTGVTSGIQAQIGTKGAIAGQIWTGTHSFPSTTTVGPLTPAIQGHLSTATSDVQAQINSKAAKAGDTYTGAHNFAGAAVTVATLAPGATGQGAASVDFVNSAAFAAALPGQTGNAGKVISTNGTNASWVNPVFPAPYTDIAVNTTAALYGRYRLTASLNLTLPASPADGAWVDVVNTSGTTTARVLRNGQSINGLAEDLTLDKQWISLRFVFRTGYGWIIT